MNKTKKDDFQIGFVKEDSNGDRVLVEIFSRVENKIRHFRAVGEIKRI